MSIRETLTGYKTYLICVSAILAAAIGYLEGTLTLVQFITALLAALVTITGSAKVNRLIELLKKLSGK